jgi:hypothetical protein
MQTTQKYLNDEHMRLYEWNAAGNGTVIPVRSKRSHSWQASYAVLAVLTSLLILNGCNNKASAERDTSQAALDAMDEPRPLYDEAIAPLEPVEAAAPAAEDVDVQAAEGPGEPAPEATEPAGETPQQP